MVNSVRQQADGALAAFTEDAVSEAEPQVLREALKGKRRRDLVIGITSWVLAALIWTLLLILFALVLKWADIDVISYLHKLQPPTRTP